MYISRNISRRQKAQRQSQRHVHVTPKSLFQKMRPIVLLSPQAPSRSGTISRIPRPNIMAIMTEPVVANYPSSYTPSASASISRSSTSAQFANTPVIAGYEPVDRINTPGKLRAFFSDVKRSRSEGSNGAAVSVPQKYRDMLNEERQKRSESPLFTGGPGTAIQNGAGSLSRPGEVDRSRRNTTISMFSANVRIDKSLEHKLDGDNEFDDSFSAPTSPTSPLSPLNRDSSFARPRPSDRPADVIMEDAAEESQRPVIASAVSPGLSSMFQTPVQSPALMHKEPAQATPPPRVAPSTSTPAPLSPETEQKRKEDALRALKDRQLKNLQQRKSIVADATKTEEAETVTTPPPVARKLEVKAVEPVKVHEPVEKVEPMETEVEEEEEEEEEPAEGLSRCEHCRRTFATDRVARHENVCSSNPTKKTRKVFDGTSIRTKGTEFEGAAKKKGTKTAPKVAPKKVDWRKQHEDFINAIRSAKETDAK